MGMSASDMVSRDSADAKESLAAWSARPDCVDWEWRGLRLCGGGGTKERQAHHTTVIDSKVKLEAERMDWSGGPVK